MLESESIVKSTDGVERGAHTKDTSTSSGPHPGRRNGAVSLPGGGMSWRVWAPRAERVDLMLAENRTIPMAKVERGYFHHQEPAIADGQRYSYRLNGGP